MKLSIFQQTDGTAFVVAYDPEDAAAVWSGHNGGDEYPDEPDESPAWVRVTADGMDIGQVGADGAQAEILRAHRRGCQPAQAQVVIRATGDGFLNQRGKISILAPVAWWIRATGRGYLAGGRS